MIKTIGSSSNEKKIEQINISGTSLLLGKLFNEVEFDKIGSELFKNLVLYIVLEGALTFTLQNSILA